MNLIKMFIVQYLKKFTQKSYRGEKIEIPQFGLRHQNVNAPLGGIDVDR